MGHEEACLETLCLHELITDQFICLTYNKTGLGWVVLLAKCAVVRGNIRIFYLAKDSKPTALSDQR